MCMKLSGMCKAWCPCQVTPTVTLHSYCLRLSLNCVMLANRPACPGESRPSQPTLLGLFVYTISLASWMLAIEPQAAHTGSTSFSELSPWHVICGEYFVLFETSSSVSWFITQAVFQLPELCLWLQECSTTSNLRVFLTTLWPPCLPLFIP